VSGATFPLTLNPNQTATLDVEFDPTTTGAATGQLTISSNSSTGSTTSLSLNGTGETVAYQANLTWDAPTDTSDPIAGYSVYRAIDGSSAYQLLNSSVDAQTSYVDATVQSGATYDYYVETVDTSGVSSAPSSVVSLAVP
jgi:fibronectin type 3 domain-containing protein